MQISCSNAWKQKVTGRMLQAVALLMPALLCLLPAATVRAAGDYTLPSGGSVVQGSNTTITSPQAGRLVITQGAGDTKAILNWTGFSIGKDASVTFNQHQSSYIALNRVLGNEQSVISGSLTANGRVFLINPNGILFGQDASVNVGGLVASSLNLKDSDFLADKYIFTSEGDTVGAVVNQGALTALPNGYLMLIGSGTINSGSLTAPQGTVGMGAGDTVTLTMNDNRLVDFTVSSSGLAYAAETVGSIAAPQGQVILRAGDLGRLVVNSASVNEAKSIQADNGGIRLEGNTVQVAGIVNAVGGTIDISAKGAKASVDFSRSDTYLTANTVSVVSADSIRQEQGDYDFQEWRLAIDGNARLAAGGSLFTQDLAVSGTMKIDADTVLMNTRGQITLGETKVNKALGIFNSLGDNPGIRFAAAAGEQIAARSVLLLTKGDILQTGQGKLAVEQGGFIEAKGNIMISAAQNELAGEYLLYGGNMQIASTTDMQISSLVSSGIAMVASMKQLTLGDVEVANHLVAGGLQTLSLEGTVAAGDVTLAGQTIFVEGAVTAANDARLYADVLLPLGTVTGNVIYVTPMNNIPISLGAGTEGLILTSDALAKLQPRQGGVLAIGNTGTGNISVNSLIDLGDKNLMLATGKNISINAGLRTTGELVLYGSSGDNIFTIGAGSVAASSLRITTGDGDDTVITQLLPGASQILYGGNGNDTLRVNGMTAVITANESPYTAAGFGQMEYSGFENMSVSNAYFMQPVPGALREQYRAAVNRALVLAPHSLLTSISDAKIEPLLQVIPAGLPLPADERP